MRPPTIFAGHLVSDGRRDLLPAQLKELMRHESIETTLRVYVGTDAQTKADAAWAAYERATAPAFLGGLAVRGKSPLRPFSTSPTGGNAEDFHGRQASPPAI